MSRILNYLKLHGAVKDACCHALPVFVTVLLCDAHTFTKKLMVFMSLCINNNNFPPITLTNFCNTGRKEKGKGHLEQDTDIQRGSIMYSFTISLAWALYGGV